MKERSVLLSSSPPRPAFPLWSLLIVAAMLTAGGVAMGAKLLVDAAGNSDGVQLRDCVRAGLVAIGGLAFGGVFLAVGVSIRVPRGNMPTGERLSDLVEVEPPLDRAELVSWLRSAVNEIHEVVHQSSQPALAPPSVDSLPVNETIRQPTPAPTAACPLDVSRQQRLLETLLNERPPATRE